MCGFSTRVILSISMPSYVLLRKSCMTRWKMISRLKRGAESAKRLISAKLLCNSFAFHLFLWSSLIQYCVFRQKNARKVRNVLAGGSGVFVLLRKFCQMDCKRSCCFQQCFPHFWWTSKIDCIQFSALTFQF